MLGEHGNTKSKILYEPLTSMFPCSRMFPKIMGTPGTPMFPRVPGPPPLGGPERGHPLAHDKIICKIDNSTAKTPSFDGP